MKTRSTITKLIAITMAVAAMAVAGTTWMAERAGAAGRQDINDIYVFRSPVGIIPEQSLRVSVGNTANSAGSRFVYIYYVTNSAGVPLYESERIQVPPEEFRFSDVSREDLNTEGEPGTGRAQVMVTVTIIAPPGSNPEDFLASMEVMDNRTGATKGGPYFTGSVTVSGD